MNAESRKIRWGVLGYARIARESVIPAILRSSNSEFYALASRDDAKITACRERYPAVVRSYRGYEELLQDPQVDAVYIPLPNSLHREWTLKAAAHGKHVLCEKPLGLNAAEVREMITACEARGVWLMEAFMYRYNRRARLVREILRSGVLGEVRHVNSTFRFLLANPASIKLQPELGGGALYDIGCYPVNFIGLVADEMARAAATSGTAGKGAEGAAPVPPSPLARPISVSAECVRAGGIDVSFSGLLRYESGLIGALHCGLNGNRRIFSEITGTLGVLEIPDTFFDNAGTLTLTLGEERREIPVEASDRYRSEVEDFADAIRQNRPPQFPLTETLRNAEVLDQLFAAAFAKPKP